MKYDFKTERKDESGAIMLEIIAVLSLMGVMGAMLFRQINHRNQELHNIQMASEIRVAKEAFSAYIQSNLAILRRFCMPYGNDVVKCETAAHGWDWATQVVNGDFLPDGYRGIATDYTFELFTYWRGTEPNQTPAYYGVVLPKENILPDGGDVKSSWNFKRAARVAMLIGGDGGVYGQGITGEFLSGTAGSWQLEISDNSSQAAVFWQHKTIPVYGATTGFDVYQPELELEDAKVNLSETWDLAVKNLGSYGAFAVGIQDDCYQVHHNKTKELGGQITVDSDDVYTPSDTSRNCEAVLWVDGPSSKVYTSKGIEVGHDPVTKSSAVSIEGEKGVAGKVVVSDSEGRARIVLDGNGSGTALTIKDGAILTNRTTGKVGAAGSESEYQYQLDPANTSVMYDLRLGALGGAKISDLFPDVILKDVGSCADGSSIPRPTDCPSGYTPALLIIPGVQKPTAAQPRASGVDDGVAITTNTKSSAKGYLYAGGTAVSVSINSPSIKIDSVEKIYSDSTGAGAWQINLTRIGSAMYQTYCVKGTINSDDQGANATALTQADCKAMGFGWDSTHGRCMRLAERAANPASVINDMGASVDAAKCRSAGYFWNESTSSCQSTAAQ